jgi:hypothetical protein
MWQTQKLFTFHQSRRCSGSFQLSVPERKHRIQLLHPKSGQARLSKKLGPMQDAAVDHRKALELHGDKQEQRFDW